MPGPLSLAPLSGSFSFPWGHQRQKTRHSWGTHTGDFIAYVSEGQYQVDFDPAAQMISPGARTQPSLSRSVSAFARRLPGRRWSACSGSLRRAPPPTEGRPFSHPARPLIGPTKRRSTSEPNPMRKAEWLKPIRGQLCYGPIPNLPKREQGQEGRWVGATERPALGPPLTRLLNHTDTCKQRLWKKAFIGVVVSTLPMNRNTRPPGPPAPSPRPAPPGPGPWGWKTMWDGAHAPV